MKDLHTLDRWRSTATEVRLYGGKGDGTCGVFMFLSRVDSKPIRVIASAGEGWDHVSVSRRDRVPNYEEMADIAKRFFRPEEYAVQYHVPASEHVNCHPFCLHWWRPIDAELPHPPAIMVGPTS